MWNFREAPHEQCCYGNCGMHVGRYLVYVGLDCGIMSQDGRNDIGCSTSECIKWDVVVTDADGVCGN